MLVLAAAGCGSERGAAKQAASAPLGQAAEVSALLSGIPQHGSTLGNPDAPVTLQYFGDLQCPFCRAFTLGPLPAIIRRWVRRGTLKIEFRSLETATRNPRVFEVQQLAALAAGRQGKLWNFIDLFYREQRRENSGYVNESYLQGLAQQVRGLSLIGWTVARDDRALARTLDSDALLASRAGFSGTPAFLLGRTGGRLYRLSFRNYERAAPFGEAIEKVLKSPPLSNPARQSV